MSVGAVNWAVVLVVAPVVCLFVFWEISQARDFYNTFSIRGHSESYRFHAVFFGICT